MARILSDILDVHPESKKWTVVVQIIERHHTSLSHPNRSPPGKRYKRHVGIDSKGTRVSIVVYESDIRFYARSLLPFRRYQISNAFVTPAGGSFKVSDYEYSWTVNNSILVEEVEEAIVPRLACSFVFTKFSDFFKYADSDIEINVRALVVHAFPPKEMSERSIMREFVIVDEEKRLMIISIWSDIEIDDGEQIAAVLADTPLIVALRFKVTTFHSLSLGSRMSSYIMLNPPLVDENDLRTWYAENEHEVQQLIQQQSYKDPTALLPYPADEDVISVQTAISSSFHAKTAWILGELHVIEGSMRRWYTACSQCQKSINAEPEWVIRCPSCRQETGIVARSRIPVMLKDANSEINATLFSPDAELLTPFNGDALREADLKGTDLSEELSAALNGVRVVCFVKYFDRDFQNQVGRRYTIIKAHPERIVDDVGGYIVTPPDSPRSNTDSKFFTPSTKKVLETIAQEAGTCSKVVGSPSGVKRTLFFPNDGVFTEEDDCDEESQLSNEIGIQSPLKKNKEIWD